jgi:hypothetical protein
VKSADLHKTYSEREALALFHGPVGETYCDRQFVLLKNDIICLFTVGTDTDSTRLTSPSNIVWRPSSQSGLEPSEPDEWLPAPTREVWNADRSAKLWTHQLFVRTAADELYTCVGPASLSSWGGYPGNVAAEFGLSNPVPRSLWLKVRGFDGWSVEVNHRSYEIAPGDQRAFDAVLKKMLAKKQSHASMTRYEEDCLSLYTNSTRGWIMYLREPGDSGFYVVPTEETGRDVEVFRCACGIDLEFPRSHTLPKQEAMEILKEYFAATALPDRVRWTEDVP